MGIIDKFLNTMKMNDEDGFSEDYLDDDYDDYDEYEEERPKKRILDKYKDEEEDDTSEQIQQEPEPRISAVKSKPRTAKPQSKISPMRTKRQGGMEVCVIKPKNMEDASEVTQTLLEDCTVILNMEGIDFELAQRIIDFTCGSCYAIHGNLQKISNYIFIITPESVDISGDFQEILNGAFDVPSFGTRF